MCGDSHTNKLKTRAYVYRNGDKLSFTCHNCNTPIGFSGLLKFTDQTIYDEYIKETYLERYGSPKKKMISDVVKTITNVIEAKPKPTLPYRKLSELPSNHKAVQWFNSRKIPEKYLNEFYYVESFDEVKSLNEITKKKINGKESRVIIPYWDTDNTLMAITCRDIDNVTDTKYMTLKFSDKELFYGMDRLDQNKRIFVTEGPIDSLFLPNCIAVGSAVLTKVEALGIPKDKFVLIFDDQPRNKEVVELVGKAIDRGYNVVIWDNKTNTKMDINDLVVSGINPMSIIEKRIFNGLLAKLEFGAWKKV